MTARSRSRFSARMMCLCALFAALLAVCSQMSVPIGPVPVNLALFAVELCGALLPPQFAVLSVGTYMLMGLAGVPVFAGMKGGAAVLFGVTGGYILGYAAAAWLIPVLLRRAERRFAGLCLAMTAGVLACYMLGTAWFVMLSGRTLGESLSLCVLPFLPGDAGKILLAAFLSLRLEKPLRAAGLPAA